MCRARTPTCLALGDVGLLPVIEHGHIKVLLLLQVTLLKELVHDAVNPEAIQAGWARGVAHVRALDHICQHQQHIFLLFKLLIRETASHSILKLGEILKVVRHVGTEDPIHHHPAEDTAKRRNSWRKKVNYHQRGLRNTHVLKWDCCCTVRLEMKFMSWVFINLKASETW